MKLSKNEKKVLDYLRRNVNSERKIQESMETIGQAIGVSRATVYRCFKKLKNNNLVEIIETDANREANIIVVNEDIDINLSGIEETINGLEEHIKKEYALLDEIKEHRKEISELSRELEQHQKEEEKIVKKIDFNNYEILVKRKENTEIDENIELLIDKALNQKMGDLL